MKFLNYFQYNSVVILSYFNLCLLVLFLNRITGGISNKVWFSSGRSSLFKIHTYINLFTHILGHSNFKHFKNNFVLILLIGPIIEEKYGSINLLLMILITALAIGLINSIFSSNRILGSSGILFMLITLSSFTNLEAGKIPITLILIFFFYGIDEILEGITKKDNISHLSHLVGAFIGFIFGFFVFC